MDLKSNTVPGTYKAPSKGSDYSGEHSWVRWGVGLNSRKEPLGPEVPWKENHGVRSDSAPDLSEVCHLPPNGQSVHLSTIDGV